MNRFLAACRSDNLNPNYHFCMDGYPVPEIEFIITIDILSLDVNPRREPAVGTRSLGTSGENIHVKAVIMLKEFIVEY